VFVLFIGVRVKSTQNVFGTNVDVEIVINELGDVTNVFDCTVVEDWSGN
jgi:hypothetical protein